MKRSPHCYSLLVDIRFKNTWMTISHDCRLLYAVNCYCDVLRLVSVLKLRSNSVDGIHFLLLCQCLHLVDKFPTNIFKYHAMCHKEKNVSGDSAATRFMLERVLRLRRIAKCEFMIRNDEVFYRNRWQLYRLFPHSMPRNCLLQPKCLHKCSCRPDSTWNSDLLLQETRVHSPIIEW